GGDGEAFDGVGGPAGCDAADDAQTGLGGGQADANSRVFRVAGFLPEGRYFFQLMLKAVGSDLTSEIELLLFGDLGLWRKDLAQPLDDAADDLADAGLGDVVAVS